MKNLVKRAGILCMSVVVMFMAAVLIVLVHAAKFFRKGFYHG